MQQATERPVALVTGGSRGIGRAVCLALAEKGFDVCVNYCGNTQMAEQTAELCRQKGVNAQPFAADVSDAAACEAMMTFVVQQFGRLDVLVNNAGITRDGLILRMSEEDYDAVMNTGLKGAFLCSREAAKRMVRQRYGRIINISSVVGLRGNAGQANYASAKAGLIGLTKSLAKELAGRNITVNAIAPGFIQTDMTAAMSQQAQEAVLAQIPMKKMGSPQQVAHAVAFLADQNSDYITGQVLAVDGGMAV